MSRPSVQGRPWTPHEDKLLTEAVNIYGDNTEKWKIIALSVPGRTNKACRKRWLHSLSPNVKKSAWTPEEDRLLLSLFERFPNKWSQIARGIPGRTDDACSKRYREALDPKLKKDDWTEEEDMRLLDCVARLTTDSANPKWVLIGQELNRSGLGCRNRWRLLERKKNAASRDRRNAPSQVSEDANVHQFLTEVWPPALDSDNGAYWSSAWETLNLCAQALNAGGANLDMLAAHTGAVYPSPAVAMNSEIASSLPLCTPGQQVVRPVSLATYTASGSSLGSALSESREDNHEIQSIGDSSQAEADEGEVSHSGVLVQPGSNSCSTGKDITPSVNDLVADPDDHMEEATGNFEDTIASSSRSTDQTVGGSQLVFRISYANQSGSPPLPSPTDDDTCAVLQSTGATPAKWDSGVPRSRKRRRTGEDTGTAIQVVAMSVSTAGREQKPPKLSSTLPVTSDPSVLAYVCGHSSCWIPDGAESTARFATSGELHNHFKDNHLDDPNSGEETPFRCGLKDCKKAWKSINGLQYHLQVSKAHYQRALSSVGQSQTSTPEENGSAEKAKRKLHKCPVSGCSNSYKQLSGLRYHMLHGHPKNPPTQLDTVPPTVARRFGLEAERAHV